MLRISKGIADYQVMDATFQYYVIIRSGLPLADIFLVHINNQYIRHGEIDVQQLFTKVLMTGTILPMQDGIPGQLKSLQNMLEAGIVPEIEMGFQCTHPYDCDFIEFCRQPLPVPTQPHPLPLPNKGGECGSRNQEALDEFKAGLEYPLYFMDFETIFPAIPLHDENRPYQQIPFQYSLHVANSEEAKWRRSETIENNFATPLLHYFFLGTPPTDPRPSFIESLLGHLGSSGSIIVWNQGFEMNRLRELARDFPDYAPRIEPLFDRIVDLMVPFRQKHLYTPEMNGSYSLKAVLPALVPDLSYSGLEIQEGGTASMTYESLYYDTDPKSVARKRENLLKYCELDTLSMVRILEKI
ncbi:MAG: DUF2779 domain-containing protein [Bacteroidetes bacterium]|nr:DUF2779 domain-containing protein [Bacteroidota bacterium]